MISKFEDALLRCSRPCDDFRDRLFERLDGETLRLLRVVSRVLHDIVDHHPGRLFRNLYINAPLTDQAHVDWLEILVPFCHNLIIIFGKTDVDKRNNTASSGSRRISRSSEEFSRTRQAVARSSWPKKWRDSILSVSTNARTSALPARPSISQRSRRDTARLQWQNIFARCHQVCVLTLRIHGDPAWPGRTDIEDTLVTVRAALEQSELPHLTEVRLTPVHAMGIIHLRWHGLGAFGSSPTALPTPCIWHRIGTLEIQLQNPIITNHRSISAAQASMFTKILHDYLRSFTPTLRCLRFVWLGGQDGPSPLTLHLEIGLQERQPLKWPRLEQVWLGGITHPHQTIRVVPDLAPHVERLKILRTMHRGSATLDHAHDSSAWVDVLLGKRRSDSSSWADCSSSLYSQSARSSTLTNGGVSRTSRLVPFMLDLTRR